jgi:hypothetical protein
MRRERIFCSVFKEQERGAGSVSPSLIASRFRVSRAAVVGGAGSLFASAAVGQELFCCFAAFFARCRPRRSCRSREPRVVVRSSGRVKRLFSLGAFFLPRSPPRPSFARLAEALLPSREGEPMHVGPGVKPQKQGVVKFFSFLLIPLGLGYRTEMPRFIRPSIPGRGSQRCGNRCPGSGLR